MGKSPENLEKLPWPSWGVFPPGSTHGAVLQCAFDLVIAFAFLAVGWVLMRVVRQRQDRVHAWLFTVSATALGIGALGHLMRAACIFSPALYPWVDAGAKVGNLLVALTLAFAATKALPWALSLPTHAALANEKNRLTQLVNELAAAGEQRFKLALEASPNGILVVDEKGQITFANAQIENLFGYARDALLGESFEKLIPQGARGAHATHVRRFREDPVARAMGAGREVRGLRRDGREFAAEIALGPFRYEGRMHVIAFVADISARKHAEKRIQEQSHELERSNQDLESFAYAASHDLQEPLRGMMGYLQLFQRQFGDTLPEKARHFIDQATESGRRMKVLMDALLQYSRAGRPSAVAPVDMSQVVADILNDLHAPIRESGAQIELGTLPVIPGDPTVARQILQNLLSNALKFRKGPPRIEIGSQVVDGETVFHVRDNGIGIPLAYQGRLFMLFQRLHARGAYPGSGIGLALAAKAIRARGGRIWVESAEDEGAVFYFTLEAKTAPALVAKASDAEPQTPSSPDAVQERIS